MVKIGDFIIPYNSKLSEYSKFEDYLYELIYVKTADLA